MGRSGAPSEAEEAFATEVRLFRNLATETDPASQTYLANALCDLAEHLLKQGDREQDALVAIQEGQDVCRRHTPDGPQELRYIEASLSGMHAVASHRLDDHRTALTHAEHAVTGLRKAEWKTREYRPDLAKALQVLALSLYSVGRLKDARKNIQEAAHMFGRLSKKEPDFYLAELADTKLAAGMILDAEGKRLRAVAEYELAADAYAKVLVYNPTVEAEFRTAATAAIEGNAALRNPGRANKLRRRYGL
jgi:tetratricopeptide (TPR) repeat protein